MQGTGTCVYVCFCVSGLGCCKSDLQVVECLGCPQTPQSLGCVVCCQIHWPTQVPSVLVDSDGDQVRSALDALLAQQSAATFGRSRSYVAGSYEHMCVLGGGVRHVDSGTAWQCVNIGSASDGPIVYMLGGCG
jgi:hypothetical protein